MIGLLEQSQSSVSCAVALPGWTWLLRSIGLFIGIGKNKSRTECFMFVLSPSSSRKLVAVDI